MLSVQAAFEPVEEDPTALKVDVADLEQPDFAGA
jgi:hypothetical protein